jgi:hypothetical protein
MKYIIMCGGKYKEFETPKHLLKINDEVIVERTIRLLKENGITDIAISTDNPAFDYLDVPKLRHENKFEANGDKEKTNSKYCWLNAYYPMEEPCCYIHGDVYFSDEAIKTIVNTEVENTMFFCTFDWSDGEKDKRNYKGREPFAYKVVNQKLFRNAINDLLRMVDEGKFKNGKPPICWQLYRYLNNLDLNYNAKEWTEINNIFQTKGDYVVINDYTTDIDHPEDAKVLEEWLKK